MIHPLMGFLSLSSVLYCVNSESLSASSLSAHFAPNATTSASQPFQQREKRQDPQPITTCGYLNGNRKLSRTADPGFGCRVDTANGLWGFCPVTVNQARDCGLAGYCVDSNSCINGCGRLSDRSDITTFTCQSRQSCSIALLINGPDQSFEYIACGDRFTTERLLAIPKDVEATTTSSAFSTPKSVSVIPSMTTSFTEPISSVKLETSTSTSTFQSNAPTRSTTNIGAIVGGTVGGAAVVCLTGLGILFLRRKRGLAAVLHPHAQHHSQGDFANTDELISHSTVTTQKPNQWNGSHEPVEMYGHDVITDPVELPGTEQRGR